MYEDKLADLVRLQSHVRSLIASIKRQNALSGKDYSQMTQKAAQKNGADLSWCAMDIEKEMSQAHAAAVDCGIASPKPSEQYGPISFRPSAFHHYTYQPPKPRCRQ